MSLVVKKKAGKGFAPKFLQRRPGAPSSSQSSTRPSVERQSQTPAPLQAIESIVIPDDDGTPNLADDSSRVVETNTHPHPLETPEDTLSHGSTVDEACALNSSAVAQNIALLPDKESPKRKSRDGDGEVEALQKRHRSSGLDVPKSPPRTAAPVKHSQITEARSQWPRPDAIPLSLPEPTISESQSVASVRHSEETPHLLEAITTEASTNVESSQVTTPVPEITAPTSQRHPLPENTRGSTDGESDPAITTNGLGPAGDVGSGAEGRQLAQTPVIVPMAPLNPDGTPREPSQQPAISTKKKSTRRRKVQAAEDSGDVRATVEIQLNRRRRVPGKTPKRNRKDDGTKKGKRLETPEGAEDEEINEKEIKMADLCKDLRIGQKFSKHDELRQREKQGLILKAQLAKHPELALVIDGREGTEGGDAGPDEGAEREQPIILGSGPQMKVVDGQIVMDASSMQLDRHGQARATQGQLVAEVENEFSKITTSGTHMKRERAQLWDIAANETFWKGLRMFGTDFEMISKLFPSRNRRQIKLKFNKEEKDNPAKIDRILKGIGSSIELDTYEELSGVKLEDVAAIEAEREKIEAEQKAEEDKRIAEHADAEKKKKDAIDAQRAAAVRGLATTDDNGGSGEKENHEGSPPQETGPGGQKTQVWSQTSKAPKGKKGATARRSKRRGAADETVQVLGDA